MKLPDTLTIKLVSNKKEIQLNDIALRLILFKSYRNNHHIILPNSDIDGIVTINKEMMLSDINLDRSLFMMDYDIHNDFESVIEVSVLTEQEIINAYRGGIEYNLRAKIPIKYKMLESAENYKVKPNTVKQDIGGENNPIIEFSIDSCSDQSSNNLKKLHEDERIYLVAGYGGSKELLALLNQKNINCKNRFGLSLLHSAILGNNKKVVNMLLYNNINVNITDYNGETALHYLAKFPTDIDIARNIIDRGGDLSIKDAYGNSAYRIAKIYQKENRDLQELLYYKDKKNN